MGRADIKVTEFNKVTNKNDITEYEVISSVYGRHCRLFLKKYDALNEWHIILPKVTKEEVNQDDTFKTISFRFSGLSELAVVVSEIIERKADFDVNLEKILIELTSYRTISIKQNIISKRDKKRIKMIEHSIASQICIRDLKINSYV